MIYQCTKFFLSSALFSSRRLHSNGSVQLGKNTHAIFYLIYVSLSWLLKFVNKNIFEETLKEPSGKMNCGRQNNNNSQFSTNASLNIMQPKETDNVFLPTRAFYLFLTGWIWYCVRVTWSAHIPVVLYIEFTVNDIVVNDANRSPIQFMTLLRKLIMYINVSKLMKNDSRRIVPA